jgi:hypothetical protein
MRKSLFVRRLGASLLAACGSDGHGDAEAAPALPTNAVVAASSTAAKGLMANADVGVHAIDAAGQVAEPPLATTTTDAQGRYSLQFAANQGQPYVVRVSANSDTTHADEVTAPCSHCRWTS